MRKDLSKDLSYQITKNDLPHLPQDLPGWFIEKDLQQDLLKDLLYSIIREDLLEKLLFHVMKKDLPKDLSVQFTKNDLPKDLSKKIYQKRSTGARLQKQIYNVRL